MKKEIRAKLKDIASAIFGEHSVYEDANQQIKYLQNECTLIIRTDDKTIIHRYTSVIQACDYKISWEYDHFYYDNTKNLAGFVITFTDEVCEQ